MFNNEEIPNIIVTGGCGFIGSHFTERLLDEGFCVTVVDDKRQGDWVIPHPNVKYYFEDVANFNPFRGEITPPVAIFHLANSPRVRRSLERPTETIVNNIASTAAVADWARIMNCRLFFATSSSTQYSDSDNPYTWSKANCEDLLELYHRLYQLDYSKLYFYSVYGPGEADYGEYSTVIRCFKKKYLENKPLQVFGTGKKERDFTHVYDVVQGLIQLLADENAPKIVHFGKGSPRRIKDIAEAFDHPIINAFDQPGEAQKTLCKTPYIECPTEVIAYIKDWVKRNHNRSKDD